MAVRGPEQTPGRDNNVDPDMYGPPEAKRQVRGGTVTAGPHSYMSRWAFKSRESKYLFQLKNRCLSVERVSCSNILSVFKFSRLFVFLYVDTSSVVFMQLW